MFDGLIDGYTQSILIFAGINVIAAYSFFAPFKTGQVSIGQAGFMAVGAYASATLTQKFGIPFLIGLPVGALIAGMVGVVVGFPALRIKGIYLLLLTLGFSEIVQVVVLSWDYVGGAQGFRNIPFNTHTLDYVMRKTDTGWKVVDVLADGSVSRVAVLRSDFSALFDKGGAPALEASLQQKTAELALASACLPKPRRHTSTCAAGIAIGPYRYPTLVERAGVVIRADLRNPLDAG